MRKRIGWHWLLVNQCERSDSERWGGRTNSLHKTHAPCVLVQLCPSSALRAPSPQRGEGGHVCPPATCAPVPPTVAPPRLTSNRGHPQRQRLGRSLALPKPKVRRETRRLGGESRQSQFMIRNSGPSDIPQQRVCMAPATSNWGTNPPAVSSV